LLSGVIISAVAGGQLMARTGRYRRLMFGAMIVTAAGLALLTQLRVDTPQPILWAWMFVTGLGVGPMFAVFPLIVQSNVPVTQIGAASSSVSFFQQVGGGPAGGWPGARDRRWDPGAHRSRQRRRGCLPRVAPGRCAWPGRAIRSGDRRGGPRGVFDRDGEHVRDRSRHVVGRCRTRVALPGGARDRDGSGLVVTGGRTGGAVGVRRLRSLHLRRGVRP